MTLELLFPHFDELIRTPEDVQRLNEAILQLAVQGKLVPQDSEDEPAGELLKIIKERHQKGFERDQIKTGPTGPPIRGNRVPFDVPTGWHWFQLGDIAHLINGDRGKNYPSRMDLVSEGIPFINAGHLLDGAVDFTEMNFITEARFNVLRSGKVEQDDLIYCLRGSLGKVAIVKGIPRGAIASSLVLIRLFEKAFARFMLLVLTSPYGQALVAQYDNGSAQPNLAAASVRKYLVALPPLAEQHRIVAKVDELFAQTRALEAKLRQAQADIVTANRAALHRLHSAQDDDQFQAAWRTLRDHFDLLYDDPRNVAELRQAILDLAVRGKLVPQDAEDEPAVELLSRIESERQRLVQERIIGKSKPTPGITIYEIPFQVPFGWGWARLADIGYTQTGTTPSTSIAEYYGSDFPFLKPADLSERSIFAVNYANEGLSESGIEAGRRIEPGSTLMVCIGGSISKVGYVDRVCSCNQQINFVFPFADMSRVLVAYFLSSPYFRGEVLKRAPQTTLPILSKGKWESILLPIPPLAEQHRIVAKVDQLMRLCDALQAGLVQTEMQHRSLTAAVLFGVTADSGSRMIDAIKPDAGEHTMTR